MPLIRVELPAGASVEQRQRFAAALADAAATHLGARRDVVRVLFREFAPTDLAAGGVLSTPTNTETAVKEPQR